VWSTGFRLIHIKTRKASHSSPFMLVRLRTELPCSHEIAAAEVRKPRLLEHVASPLVHFEPIDPPVFPQYWSEGTYWVRLRILGFIPFGKQAVRVSFPPVDQGFAVRDNGYSALIKAWDHHITIRPSATGCSYEDQVRVSAGILTPIVWLFAVIFYRHRQRRWRKLARSSFNYGDAYRRRSVCDEHE
jgi:hypothetical protein